MLTHLAIIVVGKPNAGKTTTLKYFCDKYINGTPPARFAEGAKWLLPFSPNYDGVKIYSLFLPGSRTEKNKFLKDKLDKWCPDFLFMAEQLHGAKYANTINFLREKKYHIKEFLVDDSNPDTTWHWYKSADEITIQRLRTEQIADYVRAFINART